MKLEVGFDLQTNEKEYKKTLYIIYYICDNVTVEC